jgi:uncharacterized spore protein YtfJ
MSELNTFSNTVDSLFDGMSKFMTTKTVVGEPIQVGDTTILPLCDVSFGMGAGASGDGGKTTSGGGMGGKMSPSAVLVINNGMSRIVNIKNQDTVTKLVDMLPDIINRFSAMIKKDSKTDLTDEEIVEVAKDSVEN